MWTSTPLAGDQPSPLLCPLFLPAYFHYGIAVTLLHQISVNGPKIHVFKPSCTTALNHSSVWSRPTPPLLVGPNSALLVCTPVKHLLFWFGPVNVCRSKAVLIHQHTFHSGSGFISMYFPLTLLFTPCSSTAPYLSLKLKLTVASLLIARSRLVCQVSFWIQIRAAF